MKTFSVGPRTERFREVPCRLCQATKAQGYIEGEGFHFVRCLDCGLVYQNPQPVFEDLKNRYRSDYYQYELENEQNFFQLMRLGLEDIHFHRRNMPKESGFLDIGCATGMLLESMAALGWRVQGVELCIESAEHARRERGLDIFSGTLDEADYQASSFGVVHFSHLIEHVPNPRNFLIEIRRILRDDGFVIATTPNVRGFQARIFRGKWRSAIADHLTLFSKRTLARLLEDTGFSINAVKTWGGLAKGTAPSWIKRPLDRLAKRFGFGDVVLILATKR